MKRKISDFNMCYSNYFNNLDNINITFDNISDMYNYTSENKINYSTFLITMISLIIAYIVKITGGMDEKFILYFIYIFIIIYVLWNFFKDMFLSCYN